MPRTIIFKEPYWSVPGAGVSINADPLLHSDDGWYKIVVEYIEKKTGRRKFPDYYIHRDDLIKLPRRQLKSKQGKLVYVVPFSKCLTKIPREAV